MSRQLETQDEQVDIQISEHYNSLCLKVSDKNGYLKNFIFTNQLPEPKSKEVRCSETPKMSSSAKMPVFRLAKDSQRKTKTLKASVTPSQTSEKIVVVTPNINVSDHELLKNDSVRVKHFLKCFSTTSMCIITV